MWYHVEMADNQDRLGRGGGLPAETHNQIALAVIRAEDVHVPRSEAGFEQALRHGLSRNRGTPTGVSRIDLDQLLKDFAGETAGRFIELCGQQRPAKQQNGDDHERRPPQIQSWTRHEFCPSCQSTARKVRFGYVPGRSYHAPAVERQLRLKIPIAPVENSPALARIAEPSRYIIRAPW
jgi:hypothetical protein